MVMLCTYYIRGLNKKPKQNDLKAFLLEHHISFEGIVETRVKGAKALNISRNICRNWNWDFNYDFHPNGRIWIGWNPTIWTVTVIAKSA